MLTPIFICVDFVGEALRVQPLRGQVQNGQFPFPQLPENVRPLLFTLCGVQIGGGDSTDLQRLHLFVHQCSQRLDDEGQLVRISCSRDLCHKRFPEGCRRDQEGILSVQYTVDGLELVRSQLLDMELFHGGLDLFADYHRKTCPAARYGASAIPAPAFSPGTPPRR